jgi:hypothetical protein
LRRLSITQDITVNQLRELDEKAKREQCNGTEKLAWSNDVDPEVGILPDFIKPLTRYAPFEKFHEKKRSVICTTTRRQIGKSNRPFATTDNFLSVNLTVSRAPAPLSDWFFARARCLEIHHSSREPKNISVILSICDRAFGTFQRVP